VRLTKLSIGKLPGIQPGFELEEIGSGVNLVVGPNASGKTSLCRALRALLYAEEQSDAFVQLEADVEDENGPARVIRMGRDIRWEREGQRIEPMPLPEHRFLPCYTVEIDALMAASATEKEIGERIARELSGGYDLQAVASKEPFRLKSNHARGEAKRLREAVSSLNRQRGEHAELQREQAGLEELEREKAVAAEAAHEVQAHHRALSLLDARREREEKTRALAEFPAGMDRLRGDEDERLERLREQRAEQQRDAEEAQRRLQDARDAIEQSGLGTADVDDAALAGQRQRIDALRTLEESIEHLKDQRRDASVELGRAKQDLGAEKPKSSVNLDPATLAKVEKRLGDKRQVDASIRELDQRIAGFASDKQAATDPEPVREGRRALSRWLAAPRGQPRQSPARIAWLAVLILSLAAAVVGAAVSSSPIFWLVVLPMGAALYFLMRGGPKDQQQQKEAVAAFRRTGLEGPKAWEDAAVETRLQELDRLLVETERHASDLERKREATNQRRALAQEREKIVSALESVARKVGFAPDRLDASFDRWLRLVSAYDTARKKRDQNHHALEARREEAENLRSQLAAFLERFGERGEEESADATTLTGRLERLAKRIRDRDEAHREAKERAAEIERCRRDIARLEGEISELFEKAGVTPGDEVTLRQRIDALDRWKASREQLQQAEGAVQRADQELGESRQLRQLVEEGDKDGLERSLERAEEVKEGHEALTEKITRIQARIEQAQLDRKLEEAVAARQTAEEALDDRLEEALFAEAGRFLIQEVEREHVAASRPPVLKQAQKWFRQFTHNQFELEYAGNGQQGFAATDTRAGEPRRLEELSTGTRMQLLLAVRLAFALEAEKGRASLPLFLDEVLTTADPERYRSIVESIQLLATQEGRQVFYLTAQPQDAAPWALNGGPAPHRIDMGKVRWDKEALTDPEALTLPSMPAIPAPNGQAPEDYAVVLGVPRIDPWAPSDAIHVFHLLRDDLSLLHRLLEERTERLGTLKALLRSDAVKVLLGKDEIHKLQARVAMVAPSTGRRSRAHRR
jgi:uncharacterized protein YhaN